MIESLTTFKPVSAAAALALMWFVEGLIPMFEGRRERLRHDASNVVLGIVNAVVAALCFAAVALVVTEWAAARGFGVLNWLGVTGVWGFVLAFVLFDCWQYAWHRLNHRVPLLWRFHAVHHSDRELSASSGLRFHTGEIVLSSIARLAVLPLLGMTVPHVLVYEAVLLPVILFHHGNVGVPHRADRWLRWLIVTPWMHWVHHSDRQPETDSNYSSVFSFWDRIFGSFRLVRDPKRLTLGLEDVARRDWATLPGMAAMPFRKRQGRRRGGGADGGGGGAGMPRRDGPARSVRVFAPASVSNLGCGFDIFGLALERPGDEVIVRAAGGSGIVAVSVSGDDGRVPTDPERNAAALAVQGVLDRTGSAAGVEIEVRKGIPLASGLGGSAASAVAGAVAADALLQGGLDRTALLECAMIGERKGSGADHADNAAPSLAGGFQLVLPGRPPEMVALPTPRDLVVAVVHPAMEVETKRARSILGDAIPLSTGVEQWGNAAGLVAGLMTGDWDLIARCMCDAVAEPVRAALVPGFEQVRESALAAGAAAAGLSGSGPTVFAVCRGRRTARAAATAMAGAFRDAAGVASDVVVSAVNPTGARIKQWS